ncbi:putative metal-nicotianamine transporter YSL12 [Apostasia shenzhenica]|uniref:Putative metal-nicotianamine transporter YSL12 n=1 Tax=Apostasia shenzhenica TaxID=1088818 RepID=A0A2I0A9D2_9ASPA|nr:putative metal-nicotianamine transporter YSL12 [Apostasia shenzhenica]
MAQFPPVGQERGKRGRRSGCAEAEADGDQETMSIEKAFEGNRIPPSREQLTFRAMAVSFFLSDIFSIIVMTLNMTTGIIPSLNVSAGLLGFFFLKSWMEILEKSGLLRQPFTRQENTVIQTCDVAAYGIAFSVLALAQVKPPICMSFLSRKNNDKVDAFAQLKKSKRPSPRSSRRLITISTAGGRWQDKWDCDYIVTLQELQLADLAEEGEKHSEVFVSLSIQKVFLFLTYNMQDSLHFHIHHHHLLLLSSTLALGFLWTGGSSRPSRGNAVAAVCHTARR